LILKVLKLQEWFEVWQSSLHMSNLKSQSPKENKVEVHNMQNLNQYLASQNVLYNFFKWISDVIFPLRSIVLEAPLKEHSTLLKVKIPMNTLAQNLNRKIIVSHLQNWIFEAKSRLEIEIFKNINYYK